MPLSAPPTFKPAFFSIPLGSAGTVLTSNGADAEPSFQGSGGGGIGAYLKYILAAGTTSNLKPASDWPNSYGRLDLDTSAGDATLDALAIGNDGQMLAITNIGPNVLTLTGFRFPTSLELPQYGAVLAVYYAQDVNLWVLI